MDINRDLLFVYGTLLTAGNQFGLYLSNNSKYLKKGRFRGKLYDIGHYPGAVLAAEDDYYVYGTIYRLNNPTEAFGMLDGYEGISPAMPQPYEYSRELIAIETGDKNLTCWVYLYNWPVDEGSLIVSGDYLGYKK